MTDKETFRLLVAPPSPIKVAEGETIMAGGFCTSIERSIKETFSIFEAVTFCPETEVPLLPTSSNFELLSSGNVMK